MTRSFERIAAAALFAAIIPAKQLADIRRYIMTI